MASPAGTTVEDLREQVKILNEGRSVYAVLLRNVFTKDECQAFIDRSETQGYDAALINIGLGREVLATNVRNNDRCIIDDAAFAQVLFDRIRAALSQHDVLLDPLIVWKDSFNGRENHAVGCNERLRILRYDPNTQFRPHYDGAYQRNGNDAGGMKRWGEISNVTVQLYLNEGFEGGATRFVDTSNVRQGLDVQPQTGSVLLFQHDIYHEGATVTKGRKYAIRTEIMYTDKGPGHEYSNGL